VEVFINNYSKQIQYFLSIAAFVAVLLIPLCIYSQPGDKDKTDKKDPIHIVSDQMVADTIERVVDFSGNVHMTSSDSVITSDQLKIYYKEGSFTGNSAGSSEEAINKIVAIGNVVINFDNRVAVAEHAVYTTDNGILILTGKKAKITSDKDSISGEKITLHRHDGHILVESSSEERVRVVLENKEKNSVSTD
jgi:lipopolysaccharide export system protein LptA